MSIPPTWPSSVRELAVSAGIDAYSEGVMVGSELGRLVHSHSVEQALLQDALLVTVDVRGPASRPDRIHPGTTPVRSVEGALLQLLLLRRSLRVAVDVAHLDPFFPLAAMADIFLAPYFLRPAAAAIAAPFLPPPAALATAAKRPP